MPLETFYQVVPDGTGKKIRNFQVTALEQDGSSAATLVQAVTAVDADTGMAIELATKADVAELTRVLNAVLRGIAMIADTTADDLLEEPDPNA
jgi:hypothetical protein